MSVSNTVAFCLFLTENEGFITKNRYLTKITWFWIQVRYHLGHTFLLMLPDTQWGQTNRNVGVWSREGFCRAMQGERVHAPQTLDSLKSFSKAFLKARWGRGVVGCCKLLGVGILCPCRCLGRSSHNVLVNLQQDKCFLCSATFYLCMNGKVLNH